MNRMRKSKLSLLVVLLLLPLVLAGCTVEGLWYSFMAACIPPSYLACITRHPGQLSDLIACSVTSYYWCGFLSIFGGLLLDDFCSKFPDLCDAIFEDWGTEAIQLCEEYPDDCAEVFEQMQIAAIEYCETNPAECQEAFDSWVESLPEETGE
jgi:hypothetical protein